jgi:exodeoxyribonuclease VII small subunit
MVKKKSFEASVNELEHIVDNLEKGEVTLDEALSLFENGIRLSKSCQEILDKAEQRVNILLKGEDGEAVKKPFDKQEDGEQLPEG